MADANAYSFVNLMADFDSASTSYYSHMILFQKRDEHKAEKESKRDFLQNERKKTVERLKQFKMVRISSGAEYTILVVYNTIK